MSIQSLKLRANLNGFTFYKHARDRNKSFFLLFNRKIGATKLAQIDLLLQSKQTDIFLFFHSTRKIKRQMLVKVTCPIIYLLCS